MLTSYVNRKTRLLLSLIVIMGLALCLNHAKASADSADQTINVYVNLEQLEFDVPPLIKNDTTLVPFRPLFEAMNMNVTWDPSEQLVKGANDSFLITLVIGAQEATVNDQTRSLLQPAEIIDSRTMVPLRFIGEATDAYVVWDPYHREINVVTTNFMEENHVTREDLEEAMAEYFALKKEEEEKNRQPDPIPDEPDPKPSSFIPATSQLVASLDGMYAGFRSDLDGHECGGMCWDIYTFLTDSKVLVGLPVNGGPETINCNVDECLTYTFQNGELQLSSGESLRIQQTEDGQPVVKGVRLAAVKPVADGTVLDNRYVNMGYRGLIGISPSATSWVHSITFHPDGTFESDNVSMGSLSANIPNQSTHGGIGSSSSGTYSINGNTITMAYRGEEETKVLFFLHDDDPEDIQLGTRNFYVRGD